jgi:hypothetical protein
MEDVVLVGVRAAFKSHRLCRCTKCLRKVRAHVSRHRRLRGQRSACCGARLRPYNWEGFK